MTANNITKYVIILNIDTTLSQFVPIIYCRKYQNNMTVNLILLR